MLRWLQDRSTWLATNTGHGLWDWAGIAGAATLGFVTVLGGWLALRSYVTANRTHAHAHMHHMFERFLEARLSRLAEGRRHGLFERRRMTRSHTLRDKSDFGGSVLYYLEEVHAWVCSEDRFVRSATYWLIFPFGRRERRRLLDITNSWRATLVAQVITHRTDVLGSLLDYSACYGSQSLTFAAACLNDPALTDRAALTARAVRKRQARPLGEREAKQRRTIASTPDNLAR